MTGQQHVNKSSRVIGSSLVLIGIDCSKVVKLHYLTVNNAVQFSRCDSKSDNTFCIDARAERTSPLSVRDRYFLVCFGLSVIGFQVVNTIKGKKLINL